MTRDSKTIERELDEAVLRVKRLTTELAAKRAEDRDTERRRNKKPLDRLSSLTVPPPSPVRAVPFTLNNDRLRQWVASKKDNFNTAEAAKETGLSSSSVAKILFGWLTNEVYVIMIAPGIWHRR